MRAECRTVNGLLRAYADGESAGAQLRLVQEHLASCADCCKRLRLIAAASQAVRRAAQVPVREGFADEVLRKSRARRSRATTVGLPALGLAAAAVVVLLWSGLGRRNQASYPGWERDVRPSAGGYDCLLGACAQGSELFPAWQRPI